MATHCSTITIKHDERRYELDCSLQYTIIELGRMFHVQPETVWLRGEYDDGVYLPAQNSNAFDLSKAEKYVFQVEVDICGSSLTTRTGTPSWSLAMSDLTLTLAITSGTSTR